MGSRSSPYLPLPPPAVGIPDTVAEQIVVDEEPFAWPSARPHLPSRIIGAEVRTAERRPSAMRTAFHVADAVMRRQIAAPQSPGFIIEIGSSMRREHWPGHRSMLWVTPPSGDSRKRECP